MSKKFSIYFKRDYSTVVKLNNFPKSYNLLVHNWKTIIDEYNELNKPYTKEEDKVKKVVRGMFAKIPQLTISKERFIELQKDLKVDDKRISFYLKGSGGRFLELSARKEDDDLLNKIDEI